MPRRCALAPVGWSIRTSTIKRDTYPPEDVPITLSVTGQVKAYRNPGEAELVFIANNYVHHCGVTDFAGTGVLR